MAPENALSNRTLYTSSGSAMKKYCPGGVPTEAKTRARQGSIKRVRRPSRSRRLYTVKSPLDYHNTAYPSVLSCFENVLYRFHKRPHQRISQYTGRRQNWSILCTKMSHTKIMRLHTSVSAEATMQLHLCGPKCHNRYWSYI